MIHTLLLLLSLGTSSTQNPPPEVLDRKSNNSPEVLQVFEIGDLLPKALRKPQKLGEMGYVGEGPEDLGPELLHQREATIAFLTDLITREVQPSHEVNRQWSLRITPSGTLVLQATPAQQEWVRLFLERNRTREVFVTLETTWIEGPKGAFQRMGIPAGASSTVIEAKDRERLLALEKGDPRFEVRTRPQLTVNLLAVGNLAVTEQFAYIKDFKLETVQPGNVRIADPEVAVIAEGLELRTQAVTLDAQRVALDVVATSTAVRRPIPTKTYRLAPDIPTEVTIALPEIDRKSIQARCTLSAEGTVAFCAPLAGKDERELLILVRARSQTAAELQSPPAVPAQPR